MIQFLVGTKFPFMKYRRYSYLVSGALMLATIVWLVMHGGPRLGVDFTGGTLLQVRAANNVATDVVRTAVEASGHTGAEIQQIEAEGHTEYMIRLAAQSGDPFPAIHAAVEQRAPGTNLELRRTEQVGPKVGRELRDKALWAVLGSLGGILLFVGIRYEFKFALGAVMALFHDVLITLGALCFTNREVSLTVVAALLTIAGFSINDTIVVFDRIRERSKAMRKDPHERVMDMAVNETLSRTIITSLTVFLTALALLVWGGDVLRDFSFAMVVGVLFGTYSSVYVASGLALDIWLWLDRRKETKSK
ncbi:MAG: protein translocase subunit SecF [Candidatus Eisenbacteria bacterium]|uniref:Protein-export membrane protein SecF n=1 Tax=Eiseniibacteriota bacterium TaxID=2212470 RepID=A0A849SIW4_UNCEI|nr:protein translocase subunit SecF [Candidatus Eisenbacteria bacterium]